MYWLDRQFWHTEALLTQEMSPIEEQVCGHDVSSKGDRWPERRL